MTLYEKIIMVNSVMVELKIPCIHVLNETLMHYNCIKSYGSTYIPLPKFNSLKYLPDGLMYNSDVVTSFQFKSRSVPFYGVVGTNNYLTTLLTNYSETTNILIQCESSDIYKYLSESCKSLDTHQKITLLQNTDFNIDGYLETLKSYQQNFNHSLLQETIEKIKKNEI